MNLDMQLLEFKQLAEQAENLSCQTAPWSPWSKIWVDTEVQRFPKKVLGIQKTIQVIRLF